MEFEMVAVVGAIVMPEEGSVSFKSLRDLNQMSNLLK